MAKNKIIFVLNVQQKGQGGCNPHDTHQDVLQE
jgi:hypothetical protein